MTDYNSDRVSVILRDLDTGRVHAASGFSSDSRVSVSEDNERITVAKGSDGEFTFNHTNDSQGTLTISLMQQSDTNDFLDDQLQKQEAVGGGKMSILIKDQNGRSIHSASEARVQGPPDAEYAQEAGSREWTIVVPTWDNNRIRGIS